MCELCKTWRLVYVKKTCPSLYGMGVCLFTFRDEHTWLRLCVILVENFHDELLVNLVQLYHNKSSVDGLVAVPGVQSTEEGGHRGVVLVTQYIQLNIRR